MSAKGVLAHSRWIAPLVVCLGGLLWGGGIFWRKSLQSCEQARALALDARNMISEEALARMDPFVEYLALRPIFDGRWEFLREKSSGALGAPVQLHLSKKAVEALEDLRRFAQTDPSVARRGGIMPVRRMAELGTEDLRCGDPDSATGSDASQARVSHDAFLEYLKMKVPSEARDAENRWQSDQRLYCRAMATLGRLELVRAAEQRSCAKDPRRFARHCESDAMRKMQLEVEQLGEIRRLNEKKLLAKWGPRLYGRIRCGERDGNGPSSTH